MPIWRSASILDSLLALSITFYAYIYIETHAHINMHVLRMYQWLQISYLFTLTSY